MDRSCSSPLLLLRMGKMNKMAALLMDFCFPTSMNLVSNTAEHNQA
jgi:hypothetical protein